MRPFAARRYLLTGHKLTVPLTDAQWDELKGRARKAGTVPVRVARRAMFTSERQVMQSEAGDESAPVRKSAETGASPSDVNETVGPPICTFCGGSKQVWFQGHGQIPCPKCGDI